VQSDFKEVSHSPRTVKEKNHQIQQDHLQRFLWGKSTGLLSFATQRSHNHGEKWQRIRTSYAHWSLHIVSPDFGTLSWNVRPELHDMTIPAAAIVSSGQSRIENIWMSSKNSVAKFVSFFYSASQQSWTLSLCRHLMEGNWGETFRANHEGG